MEKNAEVAFPNGYKQNKKQTCLLKNRGARLEFGVRKNLYSAFADYRVSLKLI